jgi:hypothetical protein
MWIISTFDPKFQKRVFSENVELYWEDNVIHIKKSKLFFWTKFFLPFFLWTAVLFLLLFVTIPNIDVNRFLWTLIILYVVFWFIPISKAIKFYLDYKMDFIIVNPRSFLRYDQEWFFKRVSKTIDLKKIRSISVRKTWFWNSIFNNWSLIVLSEWGESEKDEKLRAWEITFKYLYNPESYNKRINDLLSKVFSK